ncbi:DNA mismatch repair protein MLH3 [Diaporthe amygdali]|uniref:DNA mismatch repair protein MLH3 n=1 Tax=Phomopsis amygdali TaxID=1214568 RepID=UPI0022FE5B73|nr:DNA mismatch repair protein MLH3 [Diaporthe amygdali]KAJ0124590.1 DNA mismatch repair protein MLH3 [Diaporthe amygdali]
MSIKPLPADVVAQIKSSVVITSLNNVICGLIKNSLDAEATKINLSVDYSRGNCSVEDNGAGIPPSEFRNDGGLGQLHYTSKYPPRPDTHGRHGVFLASVASLSLLSVTSHHREYHSHNSMSIHNSKVLARHVPCPPEQRMLTFNHGTRVTVRDLFGSMPVRVKHRALQGDKSSSARDWDRLLSDLVASMIAWPGEVSVSIREVHSRQNLSLRTGFRPRAWLNAGCRLLHQASLCDSPNTSDWVSIGASSPRLSIDGYVCREPVATKRVQFISLGIEPLSNESQYNVLFEEVNKVFVDSAFGAVDSESDSEGGRKKRKMDGFTSKELKLRKGVDRWPMFFLKITYIPSAINRSVDVDDILDDRQPNLALITDLLKATFYEFLNKNHCRPKKVTLSAKSRDGRSGSNEKSFEMNEEQKKTLGAESSLVSCRMERPTRKTSKLEISDSRSESPFDGWSRIKSGQILPQFKGSMQPSRSQSPSSSSTIGGHNSRRVSELGRSRAVTAGLSRPPLYDTNGKLTRKPFDDIDPKQLRSQALHLGSASQQEATESSTMPPQQLPQDEALEWINPATNLATLIDPRTGFGLPSKPLTLSRRTSEKLSKPEMAEQNSPLGTSNCNPWVTELLKTWKNPVFELTERPIPKLPDVSEMLVIDAKPGSHNCNHGPPAVSMASYHETSAMGLQARVSKDALRGADLIAQVDSKFILIKVPLNIVQDGRTETQTFSASSSLVLIDQHAADERCRVEGLMRDYFVHDTTSLNKHKWEAVTEVLTKPLFFELSKRDRNALCRAQEYFAHWGICYDVEIPGSGQTFGSKKSKDQAIDAKARVVVRSLPPAILERCRTEPRLLSDLIRTEAWKLNDEVGLTQKPRTGPILPGQAEDGSPAWVSLFHGCPQGIIELIHSRSCRSAIMFNDPLALDQCADLLGRLIQCAFPFQCAHGRPSMVPLVDLGRDIGPMESAQKETCFGRKFKQWKQQS